MKKIHYILSFLLLFFLFGLKANAAASLSVNASSIRPGQSFVATVSMSGAAAWNIHLSTMGPVSGCSIHEADASSNAMNTNKTFTTTCTATGNGIITVILSGDTTDQNGNTVTLSGNRTVNVSTPAPSPSPSPKPSPSPSPKPSPSPSPKPSPTTPANPKTDKKSSDNTLKSIKVEGYELVKVNDTTYTLKVDETVEKIVIKAEKNDSKATVTGDGEKKLVVGDNKFNIVVTAENGTTRTYTVTVTRRSSSYALEQLDKALADGESDAEIELVMDKKTNLTTTDLEKMEKSEKKFNLTKYDENKNVLYSWSFNGKNVDPKSELNLAVGFSSSDEDAIKKAMDDVEGFYFEVADGKFPRGTQLRLNIEDFFKSGKSLFLYKIVDGKRELVTDGIVVNDGYVTFRIEEGGEYYLVGKDLDGKKTGEDEEEVVEEKSLPFIPMAIGGGVVILIILFLISRKKKGKKDKNGEGKGETTEEAKPTMAGNGPVVNNPAPAPADIATPIADIATPVADIATPIAKPVNPVAAGGAQTVPTSAAPTSMPSVVTTPVTTPTSTPMGAATPNPSQAARPVAGAPTIVPPAAVMSDVLKDSH